MTAAKGSSGTAAAKRKPAKTTGPAKAQPARPQPKVAVAKAAAPKPAPSRAAAVKSPPKAAVAAKGPSKPVSAPKPAAKAATPAKTVATKPASAKATPAKASPAKSTGAGRKGRADSGSEANLHKRVDSERIALHIAAFEKSGGRVEKLGVTRVLQKVSEVAATAPAQAVKSGSRRR